MISVLKYIDNGIIFWKYGIGIWLEVIFNGIVLRYGG